MTVPSNPATALSPVAAAFDDLAVHYRVGGSVAATVYGLSRSTLDVDVVAALQPPHVSPLVALLQNDYYVSEPAIREAIAGQSCFNLIFLETMFKVDVFVLKSREYDRQALERGRIAPIDHRLPDKVFPVASVEDLVLSKLQWYRLGDEASDVQWRDITTLLRIQQNVIDRQYLDQWASEVGVADLLERAWKEGGLT